MNDAAYMRRALELAAMENAQLKVALEQALAGEDLPRADLDDPAVGRVDALLAQQIERLSALSGKVSIGREEGT